MKMLILVDLDNMLEDLEPSDCHRDQVTLGTVEDPAAVVVFAFNQFTMRYWLEQGFCQLESIAATIANTLQVDGPLAIEVACCLSAPEAADMALLKLLRRAPTPAHAGQFERVNLYSHDRGLRYAISQVLGVPKRSQKYRTLWRREHHRRPPSPPQSASLGPTPEGLSVPIDSPELAAAVRDAPVELASSCTLAELASTLDRSPHVLSQIGVTSTSCRGVARLAGRTDEDWRIGDCAASDGLVMRLGAPRVEAVEVTTVEPASVGNGAVHFPSVPVTVRTSLPLVAVQAGLRQSPVRLAPQDEGLRLSQRAVLEQIPESTRIARAHLDLFAIPKQVGVEVRGAPPRTWWLPEKHTGTIKARVPVAGRVTPRSSRIRASYQRRGRELIYAKCNGDLLLRTEHQIPPWSIHTLPENHWTAIATGEQELPRGEHRFRPIQQVAHEEVWWSEPACSEEDWQCLQRLPLVVPVCQIDPESCVCKGTGESS